jgi:hypothetical protein
MIEALHDPCGFSCSYGAALLARRDLAVFLLPLAIGVLTIANLTSKNWKSSEEEETATGGSGSKTLAILASNACHDLWVCLFQICYYFHRKWEQRHSISFFHLQFSN